MLNLAQMQTSEEVIWRIEKVVADLLASLRTDSIPELSSSRYGFTRSGGGGLTPLAEKEGVVVVEEEEGEEVVEDEDEDESEEQLQLKALDVTSRRMTLKSSKGFSSMLLILSFVYNVSSSQKRETKAPVAATNPHGGPTLTPVAGALPAYAI